MRKTHTEEQRIDMSRKRRLRKKLHVADFKEYLVRLTIPEIKCTIDEDDEEEFDAFLDESDAILHGHQLEGVSMTITDGDGTLLMFIVPIALYNTSLVDNIVEQLSKSYPSVILKNITDAWYPPEDD